MDVSGYFFMRTMMPHPPGGEDGPAIGFVDTWDRYNPFGARRAGQYASRDI